MNRICIQDEESDERLLAMVYSELHRMAHTWMRRERREGVLQTTALVHEVYLRLIGEEVCWENQAHFFFAAGAAMRRILVDHARRRCARKRGGGLRRVSLDTGTVDPEDHASAVIAVHEALEKLERIHVRKSRVVQLLFFAGLGQDEAAHALGVSPATVARDWRYAKAWLYREIQAQTPRG